MRNPGGQKNIAVSIKISELEALKEEKNLLL
jgi:hypothetical protein